jgi:hypothetical protein
MRYRRELGRNAIAVWLCSAVIIAALTFRRDQSFWKASASGAGMVPFYYLLYLSRSWEILPDRLIERRFFRAAVVFPFSEITYVGPMTGKAAEFKATAKWILIRNAAGQRIIVHLDDPEVFLAHMRKYLPLVTLNL